MTGPTANDKQVNEDFIQCVSLKEKCVSKLF